MLGVRDQKWMKKILAFKTSTLDCERNMEIIILRKNLSRNERVAHFGVGGCQNTA